jgi:tetratricopeptide (TPR) repeat protein
VELLRRWIAEHKPLSRTQDELDRINPVADNLYQAGRGFFERGELEESANLLQRALKLNPAHLGALELLGEIQLAQGNLDAAQETLETLLSLTPQRARARLKQIYLKRAGDAQDEAEQLAWYEKILAFYPQDPEALQGKVEIETQRRARRLQSALAEIESLENAQQFAAALEKAQTLQGEFPQEGALAATLERLERKARLGGLHQEARNALKGGDRNTAIRHLQEIIALEPAYQSGAAVADLYKAITGEDISEIKAALENLQQALGEQKAATARTEKQRAALAEEKQTLQAEIRRLQEEIARLQQHTIHRLSPWKPLDGLRLLWWLLVTPARLKAYQ